MEQNDMNEYLDSLKENTDTSSFKVISSNFDSDVNQVKFQYDGAIDEEKLKAYLLDKHDVEFLAIQKNIPGSGNSECGEKGYAVTAVAPIEKISVPTMKM